MGNSYKVLESTQSSINGLVVVEEGSGLTRRLTVDGITQSGGVVGKVWKEPLELIKSIIPNVDNCLILGLGTGTVAQNIFELWPKVKITGVELDPTIVGMGQKYFDLYTLNIKIVTGDAYKYTLETKDQYDLILFDIFIGNKVPKVFNEAPFIKKLKRLMKNNSVVAFNRIFARDHTINTKQFRKVLSNNFAKVIPVFGEANVIFVCLVS